MPPEAVKVEGGKTVLQLPGKIKVSDKPLLVIIDEAKDKRTVEQNSLLWWTYRKEAEILNAGNVGDEGVSPWELYLYDLEKYGDSVVVDVIPEGVEELRKIFRIVNPMGVVVKNGKRLVRCDCRVGSSNWDKEKMSKWIDYRIRRLQELGVDWREYDGGTYE